MKYLSALLDLFYPLGPDKKEAPRWVVIAFALIILALYPVWVVSLLTD